MLSNPLPEVIGTSGLTPLRAGAAAAPMSDLQLTLTVGVDLVDDVKVVDMVEVRKAHHDYRGQTVIPETASSWLALEKRNLFGETERIGGRAALAAARPRYAVTYRAFPDWLFEQLGRAPVVEDLDMDAVGVRLRRHVPELPETLTVSDYANLFHARDLRRPRSNAIPTAVGPWERRGGDRSVRRRALIPISVNLENAPSARRS